MIYYTTTILKVYSMTLLSYNYSFEKGSYNLIITSSSVFSSFKDPGSDSHNNNMIKDISYLCAHWAEF